MELLAKKSYVFPLMFHSEKVYFIEIHTKEHKGTKIKRGTFTALRFG